jgi:prepilin-type N-terminal cleavage/methylation domain-containing protein
MVTRTRRAGYTLLETMLTVAIVGMLFAIGAKVMLQANNYFVFSKTKGDLQGQARSAMYIMTRELRQAVSSSIVLDQYPGQPFYSRITFNKLDGTTTQFAQHGTSLWLIKGIHVDTMTTHVEYMAFTFPRSDDMTILSVSMTLQEVTYDNKTKALHMASEQVQVMN